MEERLVELDMREIRKEFRYRDLLKLISTNTHNGNGGITIYDLKERLDIEAPEIRNMIAGFRKKGVPIVSVNGKYKMGTKQEIKEQIERLRSRANNFLTTANGLMGNGFKYEIHMTREVEYGTNPIDVLPEDIIIENILKEKENE